MKKVTTLILTILFSLSFFECKKSEYQKRLTSSEVNIWDSITVAFIQKNCQLESKKLIPSREVETLSKMMELFKDDLKLRNNILEILNTDSKLYLQDTIYIMDSFIYNRYLFSISFNDSIHNFHKSDKTYVKEDYVYPLREEINLHKIMEDCDTRELMGLSKMNYTIHSQLYYSDNKLKFKILNVYLANKPKHNY